MKMNPSKKSDLPRRISVFGSHHQPSNFVKKLVEDMVKVVSNYDKPPFEFYHGGGDGIMKEISVISNKYGLKSSGIGTREYHETFPEIPRFGDKFLMAENIFERARDLILPCPLLVIFPEGGGGTEFEALAALYVVRTMTFKEKVGAVIPVHEERRIIAMGEVGKRLKEHIELYNLWEKPGIKKRVYILEDTKKFPSLLKCTIDKLYL